MVSSTNSRSNEVEMTEAACLKRLRFLKPSMFIFEQMDFLHCNGQLAGYGDQEVKVILAEYGVDCWLSTFKTPTVRSPI